LQRILVVLVLCLFNRKVFFSSHDPAEGFRVSQIKDFQEM
jgi:hypothetical protein